LNTEQNINCDREQVSFLVVTWLIDMHTIQTLN